MSASAVTQQEPIHHARAFDGGQTPAACGKTGTPLPSAPSWASVTCGRCQAHAPEVEANARGWCRCDACKASGQHQGACGVHAAAPAACSCGVAEAFAKAEAFEDEVARELREIEARRRAPGGGR